MCCRRASTEKPRDICVIGGGIAGLTTALALTRVCGKEVESVTILERRPGLDRGLGGALNINGGAAVLIKEFKLADELALIATPMRRIVGRSIDADHSPLYELDVAKEIRGVPGGEDALFLDEKLLSFTVLRSELQELLAQNLPTNVSIQYGINLVSIDPSGSVAFRKGEDVLVRKRFDLVVGADGSRSRIRSSVLTKDVNPTYTGIRVRFALSPHVCITDGRLLQWFGDGCYALQYTGGRGPTAKGIVVMSYESSAVSEENAEYNERVIKDDFLRDLSLPGFPEELLTAVDRSESFIDVGVYDHGVLPSWSRDRTVLVGDAAHSMAPFLGQGANQAIQDAFCLATCLSKVSPGFPVEGALRSYEAIRKGPTSRIMRSSRLVGFLETRGGWARRPRDLLFRALGSVGIVGRVFAKAALPIVF